jgi:DNA helicase HerA-like ATPase
MGQKYKVEPPLARRKQVVELGASSDWVYLGRLAEIGPVKPVRLGLTNEHVLAIVGKRGSGKSFTLGTVLEGLCTSDPETAISKISKDRAALLFDTLNIFQWMTAPVARASSSKQIAEQDRLLRQWDVEPVKLDVDLWVPAGFEERVTGRAQPFQIRDWDMSAADWAALLGVDSIQDVMGQLLTSVVDKVTRRGWARANGNHVPPKPEYRIRDLLECLADDHEITNDYATVTVRAVRQRLSAYEASALFGAVGTSLQDLLQAGRLSVLLLSGVPDDVRLVVIYLTIRKLLQARSEASEASKTLELGFADSDLDERARVLAILEHAPPKSWVVIDEAQNVFPSERQTTASDTLLRFVREGRNFGLSLAFTTQQPTALDARVMAQVDTFIVHTLTVQRDITAVTANLKSKEPDRISLSGQGRSLPDAIRDLDVGQAFVSSTDVDRSFFMDVRPRVSVHGGFEG